MNDDGSNARSRDTVRISPQSTGMHRASTLPQVHRQHHQRQHRHTTSGGSGRRRTSSHRKLGLGISEQTGRLQWCPGFKCCKFLIILPVVLLPVTLVLLLLMRMDGIVMMATRLKQQRESDQNVTNQDEPQPALAEPWHYVSGRDYDDMSLMMTSGDDGIEAEEPDLGNEQRLLSYEQQPQMGGKQQDAISDEERIKRCIVSIKFGLSETLDVEERDLMKDARTSFLPQDPLTAIPRECMQVLGYAGRVQSNTQDYDSAVEYYKRRLRRTSGNSVNGTQLGILDGRAETEDETGAGDDDGDWTDSTIDDEGKRAASDEVHYIESPSALQSFWNEEGTKMSIRQTQSNTMKSYMDHTINPCDDFYKFACGNWEHMHPIPRDKAGFDTFEMLRENLDSVLKQLLESRDLDTSKRKIEPPHDNNFEEENNRDETADIVKVPVREDATAVKKSQLEEKTRLRRHIVSRRQVLGRLLTRYKRQTTSSKRKRLISLFSANAGGTSSSSAAPVTNRHLHAKPHSQQYNRPHNTIVEPIKGSPNAQQKAKHLYQSCTNTNLLQQRGIRPLLHLIHQLGGWPVLNPNWEGHNFDWLNLTAQLRRYNNDILIVQWVGPDIKNSDENVIQFDQTSLGLPTREYFLQEMNAKYLQAYQRFATEVMHKLGAPISVAAQTASELITFETQLAQITSPAEQRLNVTKLYKRMTLQQLRATVGDIDWLRYLNILQQRNVQDTEEVVIYALDYMQDLVSLLAETEPRTVANYLLWRFVRHRINNVDDRFEDIKQGFYHALFGREESPQRWKVCIAQVNTNMGMALGSMFVAKYFDENSKRDTLKMTHELQQAFREILKTTDWLDMSTKNLAELKVNAMSLKIGYPDFILNPVELNEKYTGIDINPELYFENTLNVLLHTAQTEQNKLHEPVNKTAWQTAPAIVNAYYSRNKNQIMFPAGILQPPFYHRYFPRSLNFGGIGVVIGHELTHGFDDKGRLFDRNGSIHKWWTDASIKGFDERARCIIAQYSNYTVGEVGITLNGESTQGENIADNGGIRQAFHAYQEWLRNNPDAARDENLPGLKMTGPQLFFLNFGQVWCGAMRPEAVRNKLNTAIHSPGRFRVIGTLSNSKDFAREFNCPAGSPMNPFHKCSVW